MSWTNIADVMRDLSVAQGGKVPASLEIFSSDDRPLHLNIEQENEYNFKSHADVHYTNIPPDYNLIQEMLTLVNNENHAIENNEIKNNPKLNPLRLEFVPQAPITKRNKLCRNVALNSILEMIDKNQQDKVYDLSKSPVSMFKKKIIPEEARSTVTSPVITKSSQACKYIPSVLANEYYKKYLENSKSKENNNRNISPTREIYVRKTPPKRRQQFEDIVDIAVNTRLRSTELGIAFKLIRQRHYLLDNREDCTVCKVFQKHGYNFNMDDTEIFLNSDGLCIQNNTKPFRSEDMKDEDPKTQTEEDMKVEVPNTQNQEDKKILDLDFYLKPKM